jgi:archaemetzincin
VNSKIFLTLINKERPAAWRNLPADLQENLPYSFEFLHADIDLNLFYSEERNQYHSTLLLSKILDLLPPDGMKIVGITHVDIFIPILTFLFGEAQLNGKGALISTYRLKNRFYGLPDDHSLLYSRTLKEITHELGHTFGLVHCPNYTCVMNSSTYVEDIDLKQEKFCQTCRQKLNSAAY